MQTTNSYALKEWAVVCAALASGSQQLLLRKGGIEEGPRGFEVEHQEFWLFPTQFHQDAGQLAPKAAELLGELDAHRAPAGSIRIANYAVVQDIHRLGDESQLPLLAGLTILSEQTIAERFHYRRPGLYVLPVRVYALPEPLLLPDSPHFAGCRSWVDLPDALPIESLQPVVPVEEAAEHLQMIHERLKPTGLA